MYLDCVAVYQDYFVSGSVWPQPSFHRELVDSSSVSRLLGLKVFVASVWHPSLLFVLVTFFLYEFSCFRCGVSQCENSQPV